MKLKVLFSEKFKVVGVIHKGICIAEEFMLNGEDATKASRLGLLKFLKIVSEVGLEDVPSSWFHEVNKNEGIYEFSKGRLRLFFFKGSDGCIAICTTGLMKKTQKVDSKSVDFAIQYKKEYEEAFTNKLIEWVEVENEN